MDWPHTVYMPRHGCEWGESADIKTIWDCMVLLYRVQFTWLYLFIEYQRVLLLDMLLYENFQFCHIHGGQRILDIPKWIWLIYAINSYITVTYIWSIYTIIQSTCVYEAYKLNISFDCACGELMVLIKVSSSY